MTSIRAMFFDVFGTLVDWRTGVAREADRALRPFGHTLDWPGFAEYEEKTRGIREIPVVVLETTRA